MEKQELEGEFKHYIFSAERSDDFKEYTSGEEKGYQREHEVGFAKGALLAMILVGGLALIVITRR